MRIHKEIFRAFPHYDRNNKPTLLNDLRYHHTEEIYEYATSIRHICGLVFEVTDGEDHFFALATEHEFVYTSRFTKDGKPRHRTRKRYRKMLRLTEEGFGKLCLIQYKKEI